MQIKPLIRDSKAKKVPKKRWMTGMDNPPVLMTLISNRLQIVCHKQIYLRKSKK